MDVDGLGHSGLSVSGRVLITGLGNFILDLTGYDNAVNFTG